MTKKKTLSQWQVSENISASKIAGRADVSRDAVRRALDGQHIRIRTAQAISDLTGGTVPVEWLLVGKA